jgi:arylsulfatase A-like enzyme
MGQLDNTIVVFTTDNGAEAITFPDGGVTPFKGQKGEAWEGGYRAPMVIRWPGVIAPGTVKNQLFAALDWVPTLVDIAGGPKGNELKQQIEAGQYPGIVKRTGEESERQSRGRLAAGVTNGAGAPFGASADQTRFVLRKAPALGAMRKVGRSKADR